MDRRGHIHDNIFIERLRKSIKYEESYFHFWETVRQAKSKMSQILLDSTIEKDRIRLWDIAHSMELILDRTQLIQSLGLLG
ncbi:MAG: hypothetical protein ABIL68_03345 [bacterium]